MIEPTNIKYEILTVADASAQAEAELAVVVLETDKGRIGLYMTRRVFELLGHEIRQALERAGSPSQPR